MRTQSLKDRSFGSLLIALVAASFLLLGGAGGYAVRGLIATAAPSTTRPIGRPSNPPPGGSSATIRTSRFGPQPQ